MNIEFCMIKEDYVEKKNIGRIFDDLFGFTIIIRILLNKTLCDQSKD